jgi:3-hydroxyacyl-CoA dehydrogenase
MTSVSRVAVIGCGTIGASWASLFLAHGLEVSAYDPDSGAASRLERFIAQARDLLGDGAVANWEALHFTTDLATAVDGAQFVQENGPDAEDAKVTLLHQLDEAVPADVVIASSTSSQLRSVITRECRFGERHVVAHPFNPPHLVPLVEVVGGADWAVDMACGFYRQLGRYPIVLRREMLGHIANRLTSALWREALYILEQGGASVSDIDNAVRYGPGLRWAVMGPHLTYHVAGGPGGISHFLAHLGPGHERRFEDLGNVRLTEPLKRKLVEGVQEEAAGRSIPELERERDEKLFKLAQLLAGD